MTAVLAGVFGHAVFALGWYVAGAVLIGWVFSAMLGSMVSGISQSLGGDEPVRELFHYLGGSSLVSGAGGVTLLLVGLSVMAAGCLMSRWVLVGGGVQSPWRVTLFSTALAALIDAALFWAFAALAEALSDGIGGFLLIFPVIAGVAAAGVGAAVWWAVATLSAARVHDRADASLEPVLR